MVCKQFSPALCNCTSNFDKYALNIRILFSVIVAEVTQPSLGVGYEIGRAYAMKKPILCLYRPQPEKSNFL